MKLIRGLNRTNNFDRCRVQAEAFGLRLYRVHRHPIRRFVISFNSPDVIPLVFGRVHEVGAWLEKWSKHMTSKTHPIWIKYSRLDDYWYCHFCVMDRRGSREGSRQQHRAYKAPEDIEHQSWCPKHPDNIEEKENDSPTHAH